MNWEPPPKETSSQYLRRLAKIALTLTQDQVDSVTYALGGLVGGKLPESWTPQKLADHYEAYAVKMEGIE